MENEDKNNGNEKTEHQKPEFKYYIIAKFNDETLAFSFETNVPSVIIGYGMLEFGKKGLDNHIARISQSKIAPPKGGIMNFARRIIK